MEIDTRSGSLRAKVWRLRVGRCDLLLLDSNVPGNAPEDRELTSRLYGGDGRVRIRQELLLGVGGIRALKAMGITPGVLHLNEGHSAFAVLEAIRARMEDEGLTFEQAAPLVYREVVFTTHTPVPAGHDRFNAGLVEEHLGPLRDRLGLSLDRLMQIGRENPADANEDFCMTVLGLRVSRRANAVSALHGHVTRAMWKGLYPGEAEDTVPIGHITNGVHVPSWLAPQMFRLYDRHLGTGWHEHSSEPRIWEGIENVDDGELWETHLSLKQRLLEFVRSRAIEQAERRGEPLELRQRLGRILSPDALTIGFARRFATYKRANLILTDIEMLASLANDPKRPVQFVFAGKAHPRDEPGKRILQQVAQLMRDRKFADRFVFVEDYDINVGRHLVQGVDVWLNNPRRPLEASGTSGQKVVLNGGLNLSVLDGWWAEAYDGLNGFAIGTGRTHTNMSSARRARQRGFVSRAAGRGHSSLLPARPRRLAARLDQAHEAHHPHPGMAIQRRPHGDGLHAEVLRAGGGRNLQRHEHHALKRRWRVVQRRRTARESQNAKCKRQKSKWRRGCYGGSDFRQPSPKLKIANRLSSIVPPSRQPQTELPNSEILNPITPRPTRAIPPNCFCFL